MPRKLLVPPPDKATSVFHYRNGPLACFLVSYLVSDSSLDTGA